jgi:integral membrane protein
MLRMNRVFDLSTAAKRFRFVAVAEAISWAGLLISMFFKYGPTHNPVGVQIFGMIHGLIFIAYVVITFVTARALKWSLPVTLWGLVSSIPPFCTAVFEVVAVRMGLLGELSADGTKTPEPITVGS